MLTPIVIPIPIPIPNLTLNPTLTLTLPQLKELNKAKSNEEGLPRASTMPRSIYDVLEDENDKFDKDFEGGLLRESVNSDASPP